MLAYDYPLLGLFWTMLFWFVWIAWIMLLFHVIVDIFRSGMNGFSKALWAIVRHHRPVARRPHLPHRKR